MSASIENIQEELRKHQLDGWLLYVWRDVNPVASGVLGLPEDQQRTRRAFYWIPGSGAPCKLQHAIEPHTLEQLPGEARRYLSYQSLQSELKEMLGGAKRIAMEYSENALIPTVSWVDGGLLELVRSFGIQVASSAELIQVFEATLSDLQIRSHIFAGERCRDIARRAFRLAMDRIRDEKPIREMELQAFIMQQFEEHRLQTDHAPIVAIDAHASDPHYDPSMGGDAEIVEGTVLLIDLWARQADMARAIYADQTWMGFMGEKVPEQVQRVWELVRDARRAGYDFVAERLAKDERVEGREVDDVVRAPIEKAGYGEYFFHRTGHSITTSDHGSGANIDNLETKETRPLIPRTLFSIEPGVYLPEFGVRSENNVLITPENKPYLVEGTDQEELITFLTD